MKTSTISYKYKNAKTGNFAARSLTCLTIEVQKHIDRLQKDPNAKNIRVS